MHAINLTLTLLSVHVLTVHGLRCWTCDNARSVQDCINRGRLDTCYGNKVCGTTVRADHTIADRPPQLTIFKACKERTACRDNELQNKAGQCHPGRGNSVCRCCCDKNNCNKRKLCGSPKQTPECKILPKPDNGFKRCTNRAKENAVGSVCRFGCKRNFTLEGNRASRCTLSDHRTKAKFNHPTPKCVANDVKSKVGDQEEPKCTESPPAPQAGGKSCLTSESGTICIYYCAENFLMIGSDNIRCSTSTGKWDGNPPICIAKCRSLPGFSHGERRCSGDNERGTTCEHECNEGYDLKGVGTLTCVITSGIPHWDARPPTCQARVFSRTEFTRVNGDSGSPK